MFRSREVMFFSVLRLEACVKRVMCWVTSILLLTASSDLLLENAIGQTNSDRTSAVSNENSSSSNRPDSGRSSGAGWIGLIGLAELVGLFGRNPNVNHSVGNRP